ncbi:MAG: HEAT repeat domain-containing protein [Planctomycetes bacterium]|nr:HEAT repeat domain-containing protein [Planctomycetota bacterium]
MRKNTSIFIVSLPVIFCACQTEVNGRRLRSVDDGDFPKASVFAEEEINKKLDEIPYLHGKQVVDACASIVRIGPAAIPKLEKAAADDAPTRRSFVMNVLGAIGDRRTLPTLQKALRDPDLTVRLEAARSCARLGDWASGMPTLIAGLKDESLFVRGLCFDALRKQTNLDFGFQPRGAEAERAAACAKWESWWAGQSKATLEMRRT